MPSRRKVGGLNQRRFVVEIARPVPAGDVEQAAAYVARRLAIDEGRIRTLLNGRTGPVTRDVMADKADAIAKVFSEAGVMVTVVELPSAADFLDVPAITAADSDEPTPDYEYGGPPDVTVDPPPWDVADAWHGERAGPEGDHSDARAEGRDEGVRVAGPRQVHSNLSIDEYRDAVDMRPSSTRWVPSPHGAEEVDPYEAEQYADDQYQDDDEAGDGGWTADGQAPAPGEEAADPGDDLGRDPGDDLRHDSADDRGDDRVDDRADVEVEDYRDEFGDAFGGDFRDDTEGHGGLWRAPERSPFGELAAPNERPRLRAYLLWGLVISVVLLVVLQLVFAARGTPLTRSTYEAGLAPYRSGDFAAARKAWRGAAENGDPRAQYMLGYLVQNGLGQPWSNRQAAGWYELAAAQGLPEAQTALSDLYIQGLGVQPDPATGLELLRRAAAAGYAPALYQYAELLFHGRWVAQDYEAALAAFESAAAGGSTEAADFVGLARYLESRSTAQRP